MWANIRYITDGEVESIPVTDIKKFNPKSCTDYDANKKYTIYYSSPGGTKQKYKAYIRRLAESLPALEKSLKDSRPKCPPLDNRTESEFSTTTQDDGPGTPGGNGGANKENCFRIQRINKAKDIQKKKTAEDKMMENFIKQADLFKPQCKDTVYTVDKSKDTTSKVGESKDITASKDETKRNAASLVSKSINDVASSDDESTTAIEQLERLLYEMKHLTSTLTAAVDEVKEVTTRLTALEDHIHNKDQQQGREREPGVVEDKVNLGQNIFCYLNGWEQMRCAHTPADWGTALLRGVYGEDAKNYRVRLQKRSRAGLKLFSKTFLDTAQSHYRPFLVRKGYEPNVIEKRLKGMAAMLADRATDMNGHRGGGKTVKSKEQADVSGSDA